MVKIDSVLVSSSDAVTLMKELSDELYAITGSSGQSSFQPASLNSDRSVFLVCYRNNIPVGCGVLQTYSDKIAEIKRVYSKEKHRGIGKSIIKELEIKAQEFNYEKIYLETRKINKNAVDFYLSQNYLICENYGKYQGSTEAICFMKNL